MPLAFAPDLDLELTRSAWSFDAAAHTMNNDRFFEFTQYYIAATGPNEQFDDSEESGDRVRRTIELLTKAIEYLNDALSFDHDSWAIDRHRAAAVQKILTEDCDHWTPLQIVVLRLLQNAIPLMVGWEPTREERRRRLLSIAPVPASELASE